MIYRSNLTAPDLAPQFKLRNPPMTMLGHDVPSDPDFLPDCGYLTHDAVEHRPDPRVERENRARLEVTGCLV